MMILDEKLFGRESVQDRKDRVEYWLCNLFRSCNNLDQIEIRG